MSRSHVTDVLVVGGGPAGTAAAIHLARAGHDVTLVERRIGSWGRARGDLHVPGAARELGRLLAASLAERPDAHRLDGVRTWYGDRATALVWPSVDDTPAVVWPRRSLDEALHRAATDAGVTYRDGTEAIAPIVERGFVRGATVRATAIGESDEAPDSPTESIRCRFLVIADGARSRFGRALGTHRDRRWPYAVSAATYFGSERHDDDWADTVLAVPDQDGRPVTGHGWIHPMGDGRVSVGVNLLSTSSEVIGVNLLKLHDRFVRSVADRWRFDAADPISEPARVRTPLGGSVSPKMGPTFLVAGDAAGMANPLNGHGTGAALVTGRICAEVLDEALTVGNSTTLQYYPARLSAALGEYHQVGRLTARFLGRPSIRSAALGVAMRSDAALGAALRITSGELRARDDGPGGAERAYRLATILARFAPSW